MKIHDLAKSYLDKKSKIDEKRRVIDYELAAKLKKVKSQAFDVESRLQIVVVENEIKNEEEIFDQEQTELNELAADFKEQLIKVKASRLDPLRTHVEGNIYIDSFIGEDGDIVSGSYHKVS